MPRWERVRQIRGYAVTSQLNDILGVALVNLAGNELAVADDPGSAPPRLVLQLRPALAHRLLATPRGAIWQETE